MATSEPTPAQQPDGGAEQSVDDYYRLKMIHDGLSLLIEARPDVAVDARLVRASIRAEIARNRCRPVDGRHADDCDGAHPIPPTSPREAVYRALGEWLDAMEITAKAVHLFSPSTAYKTAIVADQLAHQRFAEAASQYRMAWNTAAHKEFADGE